MIEEPNFEYQYDLALHQSFAARLSLAILGIAAAVFVLSMLAYLYFQEERVKEESAVQAKTMLHDAVTRMRMRHYETLSTQDSLSTDELIKILETVQPYKHSFTLMVGQGNHLVYTSSETFGQLSAAEQRQMIERVGSGETGMQEVLKRSRLSLLIYEPVPECHVAVAVVCSRMDILSGYTSLILHGAIAFVLGLLILFAFCSYAIYKMVRPLHQFAQSAMDIADGNLDTDLPVIQSRDELLQLRGSFEYMQHSLKQHIKDLEATTASKQRLQSELSIAHDIQMGMIPTTFPDRPDLDLYASMTPAKEVGGDLYDFMIEDDELFFIIGDVAGKGVPASLYMAVTRTLFRNLACNYQSAANIVREMNHAIASTNDSFIFVTLFVGVLDLKTHHLTYCNAAHNAPVLLTPEGKCSLLDVQANLPVGVEDRYHYEEQQMDFPPGSALLLYTDGLTEAMFFSTDGKRKLFGEERMLNDVEMNRTASASRMIQLLERHVATFADGTEQSDDLTLLFLRHGQMEEKKENDSDRHLTLKNEMAEVGRMRSFFLSVCREHQIDGDMAKTLNLALEEAVANVISYAYPKGVRGHVEISTHIDPRSRLLTLTIRDQGFPFDPTEHEEADIDASLEDRPIGGLGIFLVRSIMDTVSYQRSEDGYNILTLTKNMEPSITENN